MTSVLQIRNRLLWMRQAGFDLASINANSPLVAIDVDALSNRNGSEVAGLLASILMASNDELDELSLKGSEDARVRAVLALHARSAGAWKVYARLLPNAIAGLEADFSFITGRFGRLRRLLEERPIRDEYAASAYKHWFVFFAATSAERELAARTAVSNAWSDFDVKAIDGRVFELARLSTSVRARDLTPNALTGQIVHDSRQSDRVAHAIALFGTRLSGHADSAALWYNLGVALRGISGGSETFDAPHVCFRKALRLLERHGAAGHYGEPRASLLRRLLRLGGAKIIDSPERRHEAESEIAAAIEEAALINLLRAAMLTDRYSEAISLYRSLRAIGGDGEGSGDIERSFAAFSQRHGLPSHADPTSFDDQVAASTYALEDEHWFV